MTPFNPTNKKILTIGESLGPAMEIQDESDAAQYLDKYSDYLMSHMQEEKIALLEAAKNGANIDVDRMLKEKALSIAKHNLGYFAGYYDNNVRKRVEKLFSCAHPVFGKIEENGAPSAQDAFLAGKKMAKRTKKK